VNALVDIAAEETPVGTCEGPAAAAARHAGQDLDRLVELWQSLRHALNAIDRSIKTASGDRQLGLAHWLLLLRLGRSSPMPQSQLRQQSGLDSGFLTRLLDELDARRLVQRKRSGADRRQVQLKITQPGRAAVRAMLTTAGTSGELELLSRREAGHLQYLAAAMVARSSHEARVVAAVPTGLTA
jgi:DNA-binding MarR family transcriptional regulator